MARRDSRFPVGYDCITHIDLTRWIEL